MKKMNVKGIAGLLVTGLLAANPAAAFQEQQGAAGAAATQAPAPGIVIDNSNSASPSNALDFGTTPPVSDSGTKVFLPGLGTLGVLPKLDFGLELLYGADETPEQPQANDLIPSDEDLMIKGRVKHRF